MKQTIEQIIAALKSNGYEIIAPKKVDDKVFFAPVNSSDEIEFDYINPVLSVKEWLFPRTEVVMRYKDHLTPDARVSEVEPPATKRAILGVRPCDAKSLAILDEVFSWDYKDDFYLARRRNTLVVTLVCEELKPNCFCDRLGITLDSSDGADIVLKQEDGDAFEVYVASDKGKELLPEANEVETRVTSSSSGTLDTTKIKAWLDDNFEHDLWDDIAKKCLGCGACAYICPTCHCFDIVDECAYDSGCRRKNWDSCGFSNFTLHTSGHNPRPAQKERFRNRIMHKFKYYDDKFGTIACVGCGRCKRDCPVGMNLKSILETIERQ